MECLDDAALARLASGEMPPHDRAELMAHVEGCSSCDGRLEDLLFGGDVPTANSEGPTTDDELDLAGAQFGRYRILDPLGTGGVGSVYSAHDPELDRKIAIKVLRQRLGPENAEFHDLLRREARNMAKVSHPNVVPVFDTGIANDRLFIAMELIKGKTLRDWALAESPTWQEVRDAYHKAGQGLAAIHAAGLIFRDFKPSNVMKGDDGQIRILDFGIAQVMRNPRLTIDPNHSGVFGGGIGTPGYMAPEQYSPIAKIDARADQYAFCVSMYEALYGNRPFGGRTYELVQEATLAQQWSQPERDPGLPSSLREALLQGLSVDPEERWDDMDDLLEAMVEDPRPPRARRTRRTGALAAIAGGAALVAVAMMFVGGQVEPAELDRIEQLATEARIAAVRSRFVYPPADEPNAQTAYSLVLQLEGTEGNAAAAAAAQAEQLREEFGSTLAQLGDRYWDEPGGRPFATDYYAEAMIFVPDDEHAGSRLQMTAGALASLRSRAAERSFSALELSAAEVLVALAETDPKVRAQKIALARGDGSALSTNVYLAQLLDDVDPATAETIRGGRLDPSAEPEPFDPLPYLDLGIAQPLLEDELAEDGEPTAGRPGEPSGPRDRERASSLAQEAKGAVSAGRPDDAEALYHRALEFDPEHGAALRGLADLYFERGEYPRAIEFGTRSLSHSADEAGLHVLIGDAHVEVREYAEARKHYDKARAMGHRSAAERLQKLEKTVGKE